MHFSIRRKNTVLRWANVKCDQLFATLTARNLLVGGLGATMSASAKTEGQTSTSKQKDFPGLVKVKGVREEVLVPTDRCHDTQPCLAQSHEWRGNAPKDWIRPLNNH